MSISIVPVSKSLCSIAPIHFPEFALSVVDAGCTVAMPVADQFWGDRFGKVKDPFGHEWSIATHIRTMSPGEMEEAMKQAFASPGPQ